MAEKGVESNLQSVGITPMLLSPDLMNLSSLNLNGLILDLHCLMKKNGNCTYDTFKCWVATLCGKNWPKDQPPSTKAIRQSVVRLASGLTKLRKEHRSDSKEADFLEEKYCLPPSDGDRLECKCTEQSVTQLDYEGENLKLVNKEVYCELELNEQKLKKSQEKMYSSHRNDRKKLQRREKELQENKTEIVKGRKMIQHLQDDLGEKESAVQQMKKVVDRLRHRVAHWKAKCDDLKYSSDEAVADSVFKEHEAQKKLSDEIDALEKENRSTRYNIDELMSSNEDILSFSKGRYTDSIRSCCYELLSLIVGVRNITPVIKSVLHKIAKRSVGSKSTLCDMMLECLTVAQAQIGEELTSADKDYFTLHTDGTTKYGEHFGTYGRKNVSPWSSSHFLRFSSNYS